MAITFKQFVAAGVLVGATSIITTQVVSYQSEEDMAAAMEKWMELAEPGKQHANLQKLAGTWQQEQKAWFYPGAEPTVSSSVAQFKPVLGGRFMIEHTEGKMEFMGEEYDFEGIGIFGYDNYKQKYTFIWMDNMGTMMMSGEGTADASGKVVTYFSEMPDPMTGGTKEYKSVATEVGKNKSRFEMFEKTPEGWHKHLEINGVRDE